MKYLFSFLILLISISINAQVFDDFADDEIQYNPSWLGETTLFQTSSSSAIPSAMRPALQLNSAGTDTTSLWTANSMSIVDSLEWTFWVKLSFNPSVNNNARIYIVTDQDNPEGSLNGYYVGVGENSDRVTLCEQSGATITEIITGNVALLDGTTNSVRIRVKRDASANWYLYSDTLGGTNYALEGTANDATHTSCSYFSLFCKHTSSNATKIYIDDIYAGPIVVDTIKPTLVSVSVLSVNQLDLYFSEPMTQGDLETITNYTVNGGLGNPSSVFQDGVDPTLAHISFLSNFNYGQIYTLNITGITDLNNNPIVDTNIGFSYYVPGEFDIVINEIMADPSPIVALPEYEYVEIYNRSTVPITMEGWTFVYGSTEKTIPNTTIQANAYAILCHEDADALLGSYGNLILLTGMSITNGGQTLSILNENRQVISSISFTDDWYQSSLKSDGGWSLEQIDVLNPCGGEDNWIASNNLNGGSPGAVNSIAASNPDVLAPQMQRIAVVDNSHIQLYFSEKMDSTKISDVSNYSIDQGMGITSIKAISPNFETVAITLDQAMTAGIIYTLSITDSVEDCVDNIIVLNSGLRFGMSHHPVAGELVINEILSNPTATGVDYVEVYNNSDKILELKSVVLCTMDTITGILDDIKMVAVDGYLVFPGEYHVLTKDAAVVKAEYYCENAKNFVEMEALPSFNNDDGVVVLADMANVVIDVVAYNEDWQHPLLSSSDGVSLERINYTRPSDDATNWHSAAESVGFGTPTYQNSQFLMTISNESVSCEPKLFSPDNDGYDDVVNINYAFDEAGYIGNILIYDSEGRLVKTLIQNELLASSGSYTWNGINETNEKAGIGLYIVFVEVFDLDGNVKSFKIVVTLAGRL
jgi:Lamin Tail Domain/Bacterial Ig-like domain